MKKQNFKLSLIGGMLIAMSATVNAQWTETGSAVYLTNGTKNVGIGTTTPAFALDLIRSGSANLSLKSTTGTSNLLLDRANSSATSSVSYRTNGVGTWQTGTVGTNNFNIRNIGLGNTAMSISATNNNVGLGVNTPLIILDTKAGQTIGTTATTGTQHAAGNQGEKVSFGYAPSNASGEFVGMKAVVNPGTNACGNSGDIYFNTWECNTSTSRPVMAINGTGNVGIGTTTPANKLSVAGNADFTGNVGIGTTTPQGKLHINGGNLVLDNSNQRFFENGNPTWDISGGSSNYAIGRSGNDYPFVIDYATANVGIGTTTPAAKLDVVGRTRTVETGVGFEQVDTVNSVSVGTYADADGGWFGTNSNHPLNFYTNFGYPSVTLNTSGNFGIGTTTPAFKLEVTSPDYTAVSITSGVNGGTTHVVDASYLTGNQWAYYGAAPTTGYAAYFAGNVYCSGTYLPSDERLKENIQPLQNALDKVMRLDVKTYNFKTTEYSKLNLPDVKQNGFIAQNLETVFPELVRVNPAKGTEQPFEFKSVNYIGMIPVLTQAIQEQNKLMEAKDAKMAEMQSQIDELKSAFNSCCETNSTSKVGTVETNNSALFQNTPNPFNQTTVIRYALSSDANSGKIIIRDLNGNLVKQISIAQSGKGQVTINANELSQGTYTYTLEIAGSSVDTKLMVVTK